MVELVDTRDLKSLASDSVRVRFPLAAPRKSPVFALNTGLFVTFLPFLFLCILDAKVVGSAVSMPNHGGVHWLVFIPLAILGSFIAIKIHLPTPKLLGPILATAAFAVYSNGVQPVPVYLMAPAQVSIGLFMGMQLDAKRILATKRAPL